MASKSAPDYLSPDELILASDEDWIVAAIEPKENRDEIIRSSLFAAEAEMEAWLRGRYKMPLVTPLCTPLRMAGLALAIEMLAARQPAPPLDERQADRIRMARWLLESISSGKLLIANQPTTGA